MPDESQELRFSSLWFMWGLITTAGQATLSYYWLFQGYMSSLPNSPSYWTTNTTLTVIILEFTYSSLTSVVVFVSNIRKYQCLVNFHKIVESVEDTWSDISHQPPEFKIKIRIVVIFVVAEVMIMYYVTNWGISTINNLENQVIISISNIFYFASAFRMNSTYVNFTEVTQYLSQSFKYISIRIEQELARMCFGRLIENQYMPFIEISQQSPNSQKYEVRTLLNIYWLLVLALMATTSYLFLSIVFNLYYALFTYESGDYIEFICAFIWVLASISCMVVMVRSAGNVTKSADKTTMTICKTIHKDIEPAMRTQLESFLLQVSIDTANICALHLFKIKSDILTKMAGAVTTYLIILLQFQNQNEDN
ncbi:gustatory receptor [Homalodisca vitripennis]|nr:gustatory receptor [Homalodisca vitripennis]